MVCAFISYASSDRAYAERICERLRARGHTPFLDADPHGGIRAGEQWRRRLYAELHQADVVLCLVSSESIASSWVAIEVGIADSLGRRLIPLQLQPGVVHPLLASVQHVRLYRDEEDALVRVDRALCVVGRNGEWREGQNPYPGLLPHDADRAALFFGRDSETRESAALVRMGVLPTAPGPLVIFGPSGSGKSSLLRAGLLPTLAVEPHWLTLPVVQPGVAPIAALSCALATAGIAVGLPWAASRLTARISADVDELSTLVDDLLVAAGGGPGRQILLAIDQAEELFTRASGTARNQLLDLLTAEIGERIRVVATIRSEFVDDLIDLVAGRSFALRFMPLCPLRAEYLPLVILEPARHAGLVVEAELAARMVADTGSSDALPMLAFVLHEMAEGKTRGCALTLDDYIRLGGVAGALACHADEALTAASAASGISADTILTGLAAALVTIDTNGRRTRRPQLLSDLPTPMQAALRFFATARLVVLDGDDGQVWAIAAHEALFTSWSPLEAAITARHGVLRTARAVRSAAEEWRAAEYDEGYLWGHRRLAACFAVLGIPYSYEVSELDYTDCVELDAAAREFLNASSVHVQREYYEGTIKYVRFTAGIGLIAALLLSAGAVLYFLNFGMGSGY